nr:epoxide hydrolase 4-like [Ipomoea batatas]
MLPTWLSPVSFYGGFIRRCLSAAGLTSHTLDIDDETTLHFWGPSPNSSSPQKPALVLIHGFGPHGVWQWRPQISFFANDYNVFVPSLVFFGRSHSKSSDRSELFQAKCVGKLLEKLGVEKFTIVGTSYGGFVAYHMARMWPERVEKVVIASSAVNLKKQDNEGLIKRANAGRVEDVLLPATAEQLRTLMSLSSFRQPPAFTPNFIFNDFISEVLIVWGECDKLFLLEKATQLKEPGDNVTTLSWAAIAYKSELQAAGEVDNVGDPEDDHKCWVRPENMRTKRTVLHIDQKTPGTEIAAAMAAASIVFKPTNHPYSRRLLNKAKLLFKFAKTHTGTFDGECPFYCSYSGYQYYWEGEKGLEHFKQDADGFICSVLPDSPTHKVFVTPGAAFLFSAYSDVLAKYKQKVTCGNKHFDSSHQLMAFAKHRLKRHCWIFRQELREFYDRGIYFRECHVDVFGRERNAVKEDGK